MIIKHRSEDTDTIIMTTNHRKIDRDTAVFLNKAVNLKLAYEEKTGVVNMCEAMERKERRDKVSRAINAYKFESLSDEEIIAKVMRIFNVTREYVLALLKAQSA